MASLWSLSGVASQSSATAVPSKRKGRRVAEKLTTRSRTDALDNHGSRANCTQYGLSAPIWWALPSKQGEMLAVRRVKSSHIKGLTGGAPA